MTPLGGEPRLLVSLKYPEGRFDAKRQGPGIRQSGYAGLRVFHAVVAFWQLMHRHGVITDYCAFRGVSCES